MILFDVVSSHPSVEGATDPAATRRTWTVPTIKNSSWYKDWKRFVLNIQFVHCDLVAKLPGAARSMLMAPDVARTVGFIGLDESSLSMAVSLIGAGYTVKGFEISGSLMEEFTEIGGIGCNSIIEAGKGVSIVNVLINNATEVEIVFGQQSVLEVWHDGIVFLLRIALPAYCSKVESCLKVARKNFFLADMYVSKSASDDIKKVVIATSGSLEGISIAKPFLSVVCEKLFILDGKFGSASCLAMVVNLLEAIHLVASAEAISLGVKAGIHPLILYDIISNAAGCSWVFRNHVLQVLNGNRTENIFLRRKLQDFGGTLDVASSFAFPIPLFSAAYQQLITGLSCGSADSSDLAVVKIWEKIYGVDITTMAKKSVYSPAHLANDVLSNSTSVSRIGFIGLGAMGFGMATHLLRHGFEVIGFDVNKQALSQFVDAGGISGQSPAAVCEGVEVLVVMVTNEVQVESVLYGRDGAVPVLSFGASIMVTSTVSPFYIQKLEQRLHGQTKDLKLVDAPVSGGVKRASSGALTIIASAADRALKSTGSVLSALADKLYVMEGSCGAASTVKMANQLLAGVHIASAAEAIAFGARMGLDTKVMFDIIMNSTGTSWMFENRVPHMLENDYTPYSAVDIFVKDLGIVIRESTLHGVPLQLSSVAHQLFIAAKASGWGRLDDAAVLKVYEKLSCVNIERKIPILERETVLAALPPEWPQDPILDFCKIRGKYCRTLVVLDDDPTGTQTVYDVDVLTEWSVNSLIAQFEKKPLCFFILTNSRSMSVEKAIVLIKDICRNLINASTSCGNVEYTVVLRGDSTLRGHFPEEADAAACILGDMDAWIICPFFLQGGRYTIDDIHYVSEFDSLIPAGETEFAKDAVFGYRSSNLRKWIEEKTKGRIPSSSVESISIQTLRTGGPVAVCEKLYTIPKGSVCIVNAASDRDMAVFAAGMIQAERKGKRFLCRTAASFVSASIGIQKKDPVCPLDFGMKRSRNGGLIVVGSYVPKTTKQFEVLMEQCGHDLRLIEVSAEKVAMGSVRSREEEIKRAAQLANAFLCFHEDTVIITSRDPVSGKTPDESLDINSRVSAALIELLMQIKTRPRYILAKGGITSSDVATKALNVRLARVVGQALPGVPLWLLGPESKYPDIPYIVFPGNVGDSTALAEVVKRWAYSRRPLSVKEILLRAEEGGYAVGAFNVYNMEGVQAVIAAAEEERSPAILQIHPAALEHGGLPLVACCISAADEASVPIAVHFDHATSMDQLSTALNLGFDSVMVDGSDLPFEENVSFTKRVVSLVRSGGGTVGLVEAELGRISGMEDGLTVEDCAEKLTDVDQARAFVSLTGIDALAVCIGNVHGKYPPPGARLDLHLLRRLHCVARVAGVFLVLHGASGLGADLVKECIEGGVRKFNVNTEVREAYLASLGSPEPDLVRVMAGAREAMKTVTAQKMRLFRSNLKADLMSY